MNAFTALRRPSLACRLKAPRIHKQVDRNPPPTGFYVESGKQAEASRVKHQKLLKGGI